MTSATKSDRELVEAWRGGDRDAGNAFFERHFDAIYAFFDRKVTGDVPDLVQRTFLGCVQGIESYRGDCSPRTYLFAIARNELLYYLRRRKRERAIDFSITSLRDLGPSPSSVLRRQDDARRLLDALESVPIDLQILLELRFWEGLKARELAVVLEVPQGTVASRLRRALDQLRERLSATAMGTVPMDDEGLETWARGLSPWSRPA